jgi:hypothetical protein
MNTKILLSGMALSVSVLFAAQETPTFGKKIKDYAAKVDSIVVAEKIKRKAELNDLDLKFKERKITEAERQTQRTEISNRYERSVTEKVNAEIRELDQITKDAVTSAMQNADHDEGLQVSSVSEVTVKHSGKKGKHPKDLLNSSDLAVSIGFPTLTNSDAPFNFFNNRSEVRLGQSMSWNFVLRRENQLGNHKSPVFINYGLGFREDIYDLGAERVFAQTQDYLYIAPFDAGKIKYSKLAVDYIEVPVGINFVLNPKYVEYEGTEYLDAAKNQFRMGLGIYGGVKVGNRIKYRYSDAVSKSIVVQERLSSGVSPFLFGGKFSIGYGGINLFLKKDFTAIFEKEAQLNNKLGLQFGVEFVNITL